MNKSPIGFNGNAVWPLVFLLCVGVAWVHHNAGFQTAAYTLAALGGVVCVLIGFMLSLGAKRVHYDGLIGYKRAEAEIEKERERNRREMIKADNKLEDKAMAVGTALARQMFAYYKATTDAQTVQKNEQDNPFVIDLSETDYQYSEEEL